MTEPTRHVAVSGGYLMVLRQGDDVFARLEALMREAEVPSAAIRGFGFAAKATFGFVNHATGAYDPRIFTDVEVTGVTGTLAWTEGAPAIHAHGAAAGRDFQAVGGHLLGLIVGRGSFEVLITVLDRRLERSMDPDLCAKVLQLG